MTGCNLSHAVFRFRYFFVKHRFSILLFHTSKALVAAKIVKGEKRGKKKRDFPSARPSRILYPWNKFVVAIYHFKEGFPDIIPPRLIGLLQDGIG